MLVLLDREALGPPLPQVARGSTHQVVPTHVRGEPPLEHRAELACAPGMENEVEVVRHHAERVDADVEPAPRLVQQLNERSVVRGPMEDRRTRVPAIEHVQHLVTLRSA